jgi:hypothetical protein
MKRKIWVFLAFNSELSVFTTRFWNVYCLDMCLLTENINNNDIIIISGWISTLTCIKAHIWNIWSKLCCLPRIISALNIRQGNESAIVIKRNVKRLIRILKAWGCVYYTTSFRSTSYRKIKNLIHCPHIYSVVTRGNVGKTCIGQSGTKKTMFIMPYFTYWFWRKMHIIPENYGT